MFNIVTITVQGLNSQMENFGDRDFFEFINPVIPSLTTSVAQTISTRTMNFDMVTQVV